MDPGGDRNSPGSLPGRRGISRAPHTTRAIVTQHPGCRAQTQRQTYREYDNITPAEFTAAVERTRLLPRTREAARLVLCEGKSYTAAGDAMSPRMTKQQVYCAVKRVEREYRGLRGAPRGWDCLTVVVPPGDPAEEVREIERRELRLAGLTVD